MTTGDPELREAAQRHPRGALAAERGEDRRWALHEVVAGGEHLDGDAIAGERVEGQDGLDRGDAAAGDEDAQRVGGASVIGSCSIDRTGGATARHRGGHAPPLRVSRSQDPSSLRMPGAPDGSSFGRMPTNVLIAGGGPAALEAALALHRFAGDPVVTTVLAPESHSRTAR